jgi:dTDP-4-dehydrorhamnose 3,5-epimerase-like enzyme
MNLREKIHVITRSPKVDSRGTLLKVLHGNEQGLHREVGEIYLVSCEPGQVRGGHYHPLTTEFFTLIEGECQLLLADPLSGERAQLRLRANEPCTVHVPNGIAHAFANNASAKRFLLLAYADRPYDPLDTVIFKCE